MRVIVRRRIRRQPESRRAEYYQSVWRLRRLQIGRASDQHLQLIDPQVEPCHATLELRHGIPWIRAIDRHAFEVNGRRCLESALVAGDVVSLGDTRLTLEQQRADGVLVLRVGALESDAEPMPSEALSLQERGLSKTRWSWRLTLAVIVCGLVLPLGAAVNSQLRPALRSIAVLPGDHLWQPGPLHSAHGMLDGNCNACHMTPFVRVTNAACVSCHRSVQHHVLTTSAAAQLFANRSCADCHQEHDAQHSLIAGDAALCAQCHGNLRQLVPDTTLRNATDFAREHPDFALAPLREQTVNGAVVWQATFVEPGSGSDSGETSNLIFSHKVHLDATGIKSPQGKRVLSCGDCHQPDAAGRYMQPVRMEQHCAGCHSLQFDEHDPQSTVPHGSLPKLFTALEEHFSRSFLNQAAPGALRRRPGGEQAVLSAEQQRRALDWATAQALSVARELLEKRVCVQCHNITRIAGASGFNQWQIEPVSLTQRWMPRATFSHAAHATTACTQCHQRAQSANDSREVLMPSIKDCRSCHGGESASDKVHSPCLMCHQFHLAGRGPYDVAASKAATSQATARE